MQQQRILLLGSAGFLGKALMLPLSQTSHVVPTHRTLAYFAASQRFDFWADSLQSLIEQHRIDMVLIAASMAYEAADPACSFSLFQHRVEQLIQSCQQCRVVYLSSDGIFDGKQGNYVESDSPTPTTFYGRNLKFFEETVQSHCSDYCIIRPSYLYGYSLAQLDRRLSNARARLLAGEQLTYFMDMFKSPMEVNQAAKIITLLAHSPYKGIIHVAGEAISIYDFYREAMESLGIPSENIQSAHIPLDFPHPKNTSLNITLMKNLTGITPLPVHTTLSSFPS